MKPIKKRFIWNHPLKLLRYPEAAKVAPYTMLAFDAMSQMIDLIDAVDRERVPGTIVETGCWKGGCGAFMSWRTKHNGSKRPVWLFDSFEGIPELAEQDREWAKRDGLKMKETSNDKIKPAGYYEAREDDVRAALEKLNALDNVRIVRGWFQESLPANKKNIGAIAILRLDGDCYESTKCALEELYDQVSPNGRIVIDDYNLEGCRRALYEFIAGKNLSPFIFNSPRDGRAYFIKH